MFLFSDWSSNPLSTNTKKCSKGTYLADTYLLKINNRNTRIKCETCSKLTIKTLEQCHWRHSVIFIVNFEDISPFGLAFLFLTLNLKLPAGYNFIILPMANPKLFLPWHLICNSFWWSLCIYKFWNKKEEENNRGKLWKNWFISSNVRLMGKFLLFWVRI